jgi:hypothetical protein
MKNFLIGVLVVSVIVLGYVAFKSKVSIVSPTSTTPSGQTTVLNNPDGKDYQPNSGSDGKSISTRLPSFVSAQAGWPPVIQTSSKAYSCSPSRAEGATTTQKTINGKTYCITIKSEGAAGTIYYTYTYVTAVTSGGTKTTNFTLAFHNTDCGTDTGTPEKISCNGQGPLDVTAIVDSLMR